MGFRDGSSNTVERFTEWNTFNELLQDVGGLVTSSKILPRWFYVANLDVGRRCFWLGYVRLGVDDYYWRFYRNRQGGQLCLLGHDNV